MASPFYYYIFPDCGIDVNIVQGDEALEKELKPTDLRTTRKYIISEPVLRHEILDNDSIAKLNQCDGVSEGNLSPLSPITLPPHSMEKAGIPTDARYYAYIHPPPDLSDLFDYDAILQKLNRIGILQYPPDQDNVSQDPPSTRFNLLRQYRHLATSNFAVFGGFAYFDGNFQLLRVNALSTQKTEYKLHLSGPYETTDEVSKTMVDMVGRSDPILLKLVQEAGFVSRSFVRPGEMFKGKYVVSKKLSPHGAFVYHRDNGDSMVYVVARGTQQTFVDDEIRVFQNLADSHNSIPLVDKFEFSKVFVRHDDFDECFERVVRFVQHKEKPPPEDVDGFPLLHQALKVKFPLDEIKSIVETFGFKDKKDKFGWSALHYACRFNADNLELIAWLLSKDALNTADHLGRYPLHLACDSSPSCEVVSFLLHVSKCNGDHLVSRPTSILKRLPLHIACSAGASAAVIEALLKADGIGTQKGSRANRANANIDLILSECDKIDGENSRLLEMIAGWKVASSSDKDDSVEAKKSSLSKTTLGGKTALHLAINKRLPPETIELLLSGDSTIVHQWFRGMLPLHMAILNHYGEEIIKLLMDKDKEGITLKQTLEFNDSFVAQFPLSPTDSDYDNSVFSFDEAQENFLSTQDRGSVIKADHTLDVHHRSLTGYTQHLHGMRALHLCFLTRSIGAARLLLQMEMRTKIKNASAFDQQTGRTALHMACAINCEVDIIKLLCEADPNRTSIIATDMNGSIPLHLACGHKDARYEVVKELLKAGQVGRSKVGQPEVVDRLNRNPLARAIQADAPTEVLAVLLEPRIVDVDCLNDRQVAMLAGRITKSGTLQTAIIEIMVQRIPFAILFLQLAVNLVAVIIFLLHAEAIFRGDKGPSWTDYVLWFCFAFFCLREIIQMASEKMGYIFDGRNLFEITNLGFLASAIYRSRVDYDPESSSFDLSYDRILSMRALLMVSASLLIVNFIVSLRSVFLPFARFVGGLQIIFYTLFPFFIVTAAILIAFSATYRFEFKINNDDEIMAVATKDTDVESLEYHCIQSFELCLTKTLQAFFSGGDVDNWLDIVFGIVAIIILLNVVIAIVSDAWEDARDRATDIYWRGRITFLSETSAVIQAPQNWRLLSFINSCFKSLFQRIDNMQRISLEEPNFDWSKDYPYCLVTNKLEYGNPDHYLQEADAREIKNMKTFKSDLHWLKDSINRSAGLMAKDANGKVENLSIVKIQWFYACLWCKWFWLTGWYAVCIVIGLPCFGIWWPRPFRKYILSFGNLLKDGENEDATNEDNDSKLLREEMKKLAYRIEALEGTNKSIEEAEKELARKSSSIVSRASLRHLEKKKAKSRMSLFSGARDYN
mmetsp:Transcript_18684/g.27676  ORF Transcript_18684/g.27676 Transcript_18684/m.27676 type:complete len:1350 (+) Transcript_18684:52-4101(+)